ncbi:MAG: hypothetical protein O7H39_00115 [Gammaproteobacteria bacterium]|nr:hypothetical protein [Gammaproteobacteria bacterium]
MTKPNVVIEIELSAGTPGFCAIVGYRRTVKLASALCAQTFPVRGFGKSGTWRNRPEKST